MKNLLILIVLVVIGVMLMDNKPSKTTASSVASTPISEKKPVDPPPPPEWSTSSKSDEMSDNKMHFAVSPATVTRLSFPYNEVSSKIFVGCDAEKYWAYFYFSKSPNLSNDDTKTGYSVSLNPIRWNEEQMLKIALRQKWGNDMLELLSQDTESFVKQLLKYGRVRLQLDWHKEKMPIFDYTLNGSTKALKSTFDKCGHVLP